MRTLASFVTVVALALPHVANTAEVNPATEIVIPRLEDIPADRIKANPNPGRTTPLSRGRVIADISQISAPLRAPIPSARAVDSADLKPGLLLMPAEDATSSVGFSAGRTPSQLAHLSLAIDGKNYELYVVDVARDPRGELRHVTAAITNIAGGYARFTINDRLRLIVGTLATPAETYRLVPLPSAGQIVYRVSQGSARLPANLQRVARATIHHPDVEAVERRHTQIEVLAAVQPAYIRTAISGLTVTIDGGELGRLDVSNIQGSSVRDVLQRLGPLTDANDSTSIEVLSVTSGDEESGLTVHYRQVIDGIPVDLPLELRAAADGRVLSVTSALLDTRLPRKAAHGSEARARQLAVDALRAYVKASETTSIAIESLQRLFRFNAKDRVLDPFWELRLRYQSGSYRVLVNAVSEEVFIDSGVRHGIGEDIRVNVCLTTAGLPTACCTNSSAAAPAECYPPPGAALAWWEENEGASSCEATEPGVDCYDPSLERPSGVLTSVEVAWEIAVGNQSPICCYGIGGDDNRLEVIVGSTIDGKTSPFYDGDIGNRNIFFPPEAVAQGYARSAEVIAHEAGHALQHLNLGLHNAYEFDQNAAAFSEGLADVNQAIIAAGNSSLDMGNPWILGDGNPPLAFTRDMTVNRTFGEIYSLPTDHEAGLVVGNFFYRLSASGIFPSNNRLMEFYLNVNRNLHDDDLDGFDFNDFRNALLRSVKSGEQALINKINEIWTEMNDLVVVYSGPPPPPIFFITSFTDCAYPYSEYFGWWGASDGADWYEVWAIQPEGYWGYEGSYSPNQTSDYFYTTYNTYAQIFACNQYGCNGSPIAPTAQVCE